MASDPRRAPRFQINDSVYFNSRKFLPSGARSLEAFVVVAVMPQDRAGGHQYRIRPSGPGPQRIATEHELSSKAFATE